MADVRVKYGYLALFTIWVSGVILSLILFVSPLTFSVPDNSPSSAKVATPYAPFGTYLNLNASTGIDIGMYVTGNVTLLQYPTPSGSSQVPTL